MKRTIRPFAIEVRRGGHKGAPSWPALSEPTAAPSSLRPLNPRPALTPQQDEAPPAWIGARILPDLTPARPADDEQQFSTLISTEEQQDGGGHDAGAVRERDADAAPKQDVSRAEVASKPRQRRKKPAQAANRGGAEQQQDQLAEASAAIGLKIVARARMLLTPASTDKQARKAFRRGERWKARLPAVVAQKHSKRH